MQIILNADDLGFTESINWAIQNAHLQGYLNHASLMANTAYFDHAVQQVLPTCPKLNIGIHINLTCAKALTGISSIAPDGYLRWSFISLLALKKNNTILKLMEEEIEAQILKIKSVCPVLSHIDGHEHIHIIPSINKIVRKLAKKYQIPRIREINEPFFESLKFNYKTTPWVNLVKWSLLKVLSLFNENTSKVKFYSILNTCRIDEQNLFLYLHHQKEESVEVMVHPSLGFSANDQSDLDSRFISFFKSPYRQQEYEICFDKRFGEYIK
jgi:predicted glycoside hydrolase/deacetylase ChbG (UPF0249 family)